MRNFLRLAQGVDVLPLLLAVQRQPELWDQNTLRTTHPGTVHASVSDIWLRFNDLALFKDGGLDSAIADQHESINYPALAMLPQARPLIFQLMARVEGERLGRCLIARLPPGKKIDPHVDGGDHAEYYERFHVVLQSNPGCVFRAGNEAVQMRTGECWWFQNKEEHEVINNSDDDRIHLVVDIRTSQFRVSQ